MRRETTRLVGAIWLLALLGLPVWSQEPKKVTHSEAMQAATTKVQPEYPAMAKQLKIEGSVELEAVITDDGTVEKVNIKSGNPMLTKPAADALKKWKFKPFTADGKPVPALAEMNFNFKL
jgi:protein TonB